MARELTQTATSGGPPAELRRTGWFVYGLVPSDVEVTADARGLGDPVGPVTVLTYGEIGALVSELPLDTRLGRPDHLLAYKELLDSAALAAPVLPVRFGTVLESREAVAALLDERHDEYLAVLDELDGRLEYVVHARYVERDLLAGILAESPAAADLRERLRGQPEQGTVDLRIRLGELINQAVGARRDADTGALIDEVGELAEASMPLPPAHEQDAANVAFLVRHDQRADFEAAVARHAERCRERLTLRLLGPLAAYDFVGEPAGRG
jgi:hypothetical protein